MAGSPLNFADCLIRSPISSPKLALHGVQRLEREVAARQLQLQQLQKQLQEAAAEKLEATRTAERLSEVQGQLRGAQEEVSALQASQPP